MNHPLLYQPLVAGRDFWIVDGVLTDPTSARRRILNRTDWILGRPHAEQTWPGRRVFDALDRDALTEVETSARRCVREPLAFGQQMGGAAYNCGQSIGEHEYARLPHTDSRALCAYAGLVYLTPDAPASAGTAFYRLRRRDGSPGGNRVAPPHNDLVDALGVTSVPADAFVEELRLDNVFNRLVVYRADIVHASTAAFGTTLEDQRLSVIFFWSVDRRPL